MIHVFFPSSQEWFEHKLEFQVQGHKKRLLLSVSRNPTSIFIFCACVHAFQYDFHYRANSVKLTFNFSDKRWKKLNFNLKIQLREKHNSHAYITEIYHICIYNVLKFIFKSNSKTGNTA